MSDEIEAAGAMATAGLAAAALEGSPEGHAGGAGACKNCDAAIGGNFCANCGQPAHIHRTLWHLFEEGLHGLLHFDGRVWRTLPKLIARPGTLTREYLLGGRARYTSPLAAFLFTIFLMFFVFAMIGGPSLGSFDGESGLAIQLKNEIVVELSEDLEAEGIDPAAVNLDKASDLADGIDRAKATPPGEAKQTWQQAWIAAVERGDLSASTGDPKQDAKLKKKLMNPDLLVYKFVNTAYKFSFLLVPISLPFVALMFFWKPGVTLFDHGVFVLYSLTFASLLFVLMALLFKLPGTWVDGLASNLQLAMPVHMFFQLKGGYALGWFSALWRTLFLVVSALFCVGLFALAIISIGLLG